jgi:hypothetical protein
MKRILRVHALHHLVRTANGAGPILFDEGPIYMLARLLVFGGAAVQTRAFARWWQGAIAQWARTLSAIVWVDASDDVLAARLNTRAQSHRLRGASESVMRAFFASYRAAYRRGSPISGGRRRCTMDGRDGQQERRRHGARILRLRTLPSPAISVEEIA